jgi:6-phosphogluconolactonase
VVLTGGRNGNGLLAALAAAPARDAVDWGRLDLWWGDERYLPEGDPERNVTQAREALLDSVPLDPKRVHAMPASDGPWGTDVDSAAAAYAEELARAAAIGLSGAGEIQAPVAGAYGRARTLWLLDAAAASQLPRSLYPPASP